MNPNQNNLINVIFVGQSMAGAKVQVPEGTKLIPVATEHTPIDIAKTIQAARERGMNPVQHKGELYAVELCTIASPTLDDVLSFHIALKPGTKMSDAFMEILAGYQMLMWNDDPNAAENNAQVDGDAKD